MSETEDERLTAARTFAENYKGDDSQVVDVINGVVAHSEERLRLNVGLVRENAELRRRIHDIAQVHSSRACPQISASPRMT